jgi:hypothetical protein
MLSNISWCAVHGSRQKTNLQMNRQRQTHNRECKKDNKAIHRAEGRQDRTYSKEYRGKLGRAEKAEREERAERGERAEQRGQSERTKRQPERHREPGEARTTAR